MKHTVLIAAFLVFVNVSMAQEIPLVGTWKLAVFEINKQDHLHTLEACEQLETFEFRKEGRFYQHYYAYNVQTKRCEAEEILTGTWVIQNGDYLVTYDQESDDPIIFSIAGPYITYTYPVEKKDGSFDVYMLKYQKQ